METMEKRKLKNIWDVNTWKKFNILQQPDWPDLNKYREIIRTLNKLPSLISSHEIIQLKERFKKVEKGDAFLLQGGDCAETFKEFSEKNVKNKLKILFQMSTIIAYGSSMDVLKVGRIAGQYAKPRSSKLETRDGITLPSYRGDSINSINYDLRSRTPNPDRLLKAYNQSLATLNLLKSLIRNEFKNLDYFSFWDNKIFNTSGIFNRFEKTIKRIDKSLKFLNALGRPIDLTAQKRFSEFYVSHESLILD